MPPTSLLHRCAALLAVTLLLALPARLAADLVWTPAGGWKIEGGVTSGLSGEEAHNALTLMNKARASEENRSYFFALSRYKKVTKLYPNSIYAPEAYYHIGTIRLARHQYLKAFKAFQEVVSRYPNTARFNEVVERVTLIPMGAARLRIAAFPAIGDGPDAHAGPAGDLLDGARNHSWFFGLGFRNREASVGMFELVVSNAPYGEYAPVALMSIAKAHQHLKNPEQSIDALDRMINTYPKSVLTPDAYLRSAQAYASIVEGPNYDQTSTKEAITYFEDFVILFPGDTNISGAEKGLADMKVVLAESKLKTGDYYLKYRRNYKAAKVFYNEAITDYPDSKVAVHARAELTKVDALLAEQEKAAAGAAGQPVPPKPSKKKRFLFF